MVYTPYYSYLIYKNVETLSYDLGHGTVPIQDTARHKWYACLLLDLLPPFSDTSPIHKRILKVYINLDVCIYTKKCTDLLTEVVKLILIYYFTHL
jgi:hypothetical protein